MRTIELLHSIQAGANCSGVLAPKRINRSIAFVVSSGVGRRRERGKIKKNEKEPAGRRADVTLHRGSFAGTQQGRMKIITAEFDRSAPDLKGCPNWNRPEFAFIGRSNVGKSSLINMLVERKALAKVSVTPGK